MGSRQRSGGLESIYGRGDIRDARILIIARSLFSFKGSETDDPRRYTALMPDIEVNFNLKIVSVVLFVRNLGSIL
jgi:hypothetical protein